MAGQRCGLAADAFHHTPVTCQRVNVVIEHRKLRAVVSLGEPFAGHRDTHTCGHPLSKGSGRGFNAGGPPILGMSGALTLELPEILQIVEPNREFAQGLILSVYRLYSS